MRSFCRSTLKRSIVVFVVFLGGCQGGGMISVSHPLVHTRERLVEERVREDAWLRSQLTQTENLEPVFSGYHDWRQFVGLYSETKAAFDPSLGLANTLQQQNDRTQQLTYQAQLERNLLREREALREDREAITAARETASREPNAKPSATGQGSSTPTAPPAPAKLSGPSLPTGSPAFGSSLSELPGLPDSSAPTQTKTQFSFADKFNTRLAARTMINAALRANSLDDSHDASGLELYELTLQTSLIPSRGNADLARVTLEIVPLPAQQRVEDMRRLFALWQDSLREQLIAQVAEIQHKVRGGCIDPATRELLEWFLTRRLVTLDLQLKQEEKDVAAVYGKLQTLLVRLKTEYVQSTATGGSDRKGRGPTDASTATVKVADFYDLLQEVAERRLYHLLSPDVEEAVREILRATDLHDQILAAAPQDKEDGTLSPHAQAQVPEKILDRPILELGRAPAQRARVYELLVDTGRRMAAGMDWQTRSCESYSKKLVTVLLPDDSLTPSGVDVVAGPSVYAAYREFRHAYEHLCADTPCLVIFDPKTNQVHRPYRAFMMQAAAWAVWSQYVDQLRRFVYVTGPAFGEAKAATGRRTEEESTLKEGFNIREVASFTDNGRRARELGRHCIVIPRESSLGSTGYAAFFKRLIELEEQPFALTVQPKQEIQLVSEAAARETVLNMILALNASLPTSGVTASTQDQYLNRMREISHGITRQPLLVGFGQGQRRFGWVMGPQFEISEGKSRYQHSPTRYDCAAGIVVPGWWSTICLRGKASWIDATTGAPRAETPLWEDQIEKLPLRMPTAGLGDITAALMSNHPSTEPSAYATRPTPRLDMTGRNRIGQQALYATRPGEKSSPEQTVLLLGEDLWRTPQVFVGQYRASRVEVLPSMRGLVACFDVLPVPEAKFENAAGILMPLRVVTAFGSDRAAEFVKVLPPPKAAKPTALVKLISTFVDDESKNLIFEFEKPASFAEVFVCYRSPANPASVTKCPSQPQWSKDNRVSFVLGPLDSSKKPAAEILEANLFLLLRPDEGLIPGELMPSYQKFARFASVAQRSLVLSTPKNGDTLEYNEEWALPKDTKIVVGYAKAVSDTLKVAYPGLDDALKYQALQLEFVEEKGEKVAAKAPLKVSPGEGDPAQLVVSSGPDSPLSGPSFRAAVTGAEGGECKLKLRVTYQRGDQTIVIPVVAADGHLVSLILKAKKPTPAVADSTAISFSYQGKVKNELILTLTPPMAGTTRLDFVGSAALARAKAAGTGVLLEIKTQTNQKMDLKLSMRDKTVDGQPKIEFVLDPSVATGEAGKLAKWSGDSAQTPLRAVILADKDEIPIYSNGKPATFSFTMDAMPSPPPVELMSPQVEGPDSNGAFPQKITLRLPKPKAGETYQGQEELVKAEGLRVVLLNNYKESLELIPQFEEQGDFYVYCAGKMDTKQVEKFKGERWLKDIKSFALKLRYGVTATDPGHPLDVPTMLKIEKAAQ